jgi:glutathione synthase/RimK-type ligase-like ATP-grasp enzyme
MNIRVMGVYRETEFSPGKVEADAAIIERVLAHLSAAGAKTSAVNASRFVSESLPDAQLVLAMCQGGPALSRLAAAEEAGAVTINSALAIRNCYRDLLGNGLLRAGVPTPEGGLVRTSEPFDLKPLRGLDLSSPMYVKRGDLHALGPTDVRRVEGLEQLEAMLLRFSVAMPEEGVTGEGVKLALAQAASQAAAALGLEVWGGDAVVNGDRFSIIDFNDWPSFARVRDEAARAIARRCTLLLRRRPAARALPA